MLKKTAKRQAADTAGPEAELAALLAALEAGTSDDPFANPILLFARDVARRLETGALTLKDVAAAVDALSAAAFGAGAARLGQQLGETETTANKKALKALFERLADGRPWPAFQEAVERALAGLVFTAHPTFALNTRLMAAMTALATGQDADLQDFDLAPEAPLNLALEHQLATDAAGHAQEAVRQVYDILFDVARQAYPDDWADLRPTLLTIASWVGYDVDGRSDISWSDSFEKRLIVQRQQLARYEARVGEIAGTLGNTDDDARQALDLLEARLRLALRTVEDEIEVFSASRSAGEDWAHEVSRVGQRIFADHDRRLSTVEPVVDLIERAISGAGAGDSPRLETLHALAVLRAEVLTFGLGLAHTHVRLNATQLHNAIRKSIGMTGAPDDPARRRSYMAAITTMLDEVEGQTINFGSVLYEQASAVRLFMTVTQILKYVDGSTPVRLLIAETETAFTVLTALYFAKLFGIDDQLEIAPLLETRKALERGPRMVEDLLNNSHYRDYVKRTGKLCLQTGYSDAGRYLGQTAAGAAIERTKMRIVEVLKSHDLAGVEVVMFDTHGESIGRGAHPNGFPDRLAYVASAAYRAQLADAGLQLKQEISFQGGDGYLWFMTPQAAFATVSRILEFAFTDGVPAEQDPYYVEADYIAEFFTSVQFFNERVMADPSYEALLGAYGTNLLYPTGSRAIQRQRGAGGAPQHLEIKNLRAIPQNAILQQMGFLANSVGGVGQAIAQDPEAFAAMYADSPRFRVLLTLVEWAVSLTDGQVLRAYVDTHDPGLWQLAAGAETDEERANAAYDIADALAEHAGHVAAIPMVRHLLRDFAALQRALAALPGERPGLAPAQVLRARLLHGLRLGLIHHLFALATRIPEFSDRHPVTPAQLHEEILRLEIDSALAQLAEIFPRSQEIDIPDDFGEPASYQTEPSSNYEQEHAQIFGPMAEITDLMRQISVGLRCVIGAVG